MKIQKVLALLLTAVLPVMAALPAGAASDQFTLEDNERIPIPEAYTLERTLSGFTADGQQQQFSGILDIFIDEGGTLYVSDTANNRVVRLDADGNCTGVFTGDEKGFSNPDGLFVDDTGDIFVADTGNKRIVHLDKNGGFIEEFGKPGSELLDENFDYRPSKICVSDTGYIYVIKEQAIMQLDSLNRFRGYIGQPEVGFSFTDFLLRIFASENQSRLIEKRLPATYSNILLDQEGNLFAVSRDTTDGEIKQLNSIGKNIYREYAEGNVITSTIMSFLSLEGTMQWFGERTDPAGNPRVPTFSDIAVDSNGVVTVLDSGNLQLYQYDPEGQLLCSFGGQGTRRGKFSSPTSIAVGPDGRIYVADRTQNNIQVFAPTAFIQSVHEAVAAYADGDYEKAFTCWQAVLSIDENYRFAHDGIADTLYKRGQYSEAMDEYVIAENREGYTKAFNEHRMELFKQYFVLIILCILAIAAAVWFFGRWLLHAGRRAQHRFLFKEEGRNRLGNFLLLAPAMMTRPSDTVEAVKENRGHNRMLPGILVILAALASRLIYIFIVHFPLMDVSPQNVNLVLEVLKMVLPVVTWAVASYAVSSIMGGEARFDEVFLCASFGMIPYVMFTLPMGLVSNVLAHGEQQFYAIATIIVFVWQIVLMFIGLMQLNRYGFWQAVGVGIISLLVMLLFWVVAILCFGLIGQLIRFADGLITEIRLNSL